MKINFKQNPAISTIRKLFLSEIQPPPLQLIAVNFIEITSERNSYFYYLELFAMPWKLIPKQIKPFSIQEIASDATEIIFK